jgi:cytochrome c-type biogenesis protein CcmH
VSAFIAVAALMAIGALTLVLMPLLRRPADGESRALRSAAFVAVALPLLAVLLYAQWSNWPWRGASEAAPGVPPDVMAMVEGLSQRLARDGGSLEEWQMLGRSRMQLKQYAAAADAYRHAYRMSNGADVDTLTSYAEALLLADPDALLADAGDLFERALALAPQDPKALWYGGLTAFGHEQYALARDRWRALLDHDPPPPDDVRQILSERVAEAEVRLAGGAADTAPEAAGTVASASAAPAPATSAQTARSIVVQLTVAPALAAKVDPQAPLFVFARAPGAAGPPLAVQRHAAKELPLRVRLTDADAMVPGRTLSSVPVVEIVARVALSGQPVAQPGDLFGSAQVDAAGDADLSIEIDQVQP